MNKFLRVLFILVIIAMTGAIFSAILSHLYGKSFGLRHFCRIAEGDWYLECNSSCHPDYCQSQVRLVLYESCSNGFDYWRSWDWN